MAIKLAIEKSASEAYAIVGQVITYFVKVTNENTIPEDVPFSSVVVSDLLAEELEFIPGSIKVDGVPKPEENIIAGIDIGPIEPFTQAVVVSFDAKIICKGTGVIENTAQAQYTYTLPGQPPEEETIKTSDPHKLIVYYAQLKLIKNSTPEEVLLGDRIHYTVDLVNEGDLKAFNVHFKDFLPKQVCLIPGTFKIEKRIVNGVELDKGVIIGTIRPECAVRLSYDVKVCGSNCSGILVNHAEATFDYRIKADGSTGTLRACGSVEDHQTHTQVAITNFKQLNIESYLMIPEQKPPIETLNVVTGNIDIKEFHVIETPRMRSTEGQKLTGFKLIVRGSLNISIEYTALEEEQSVHSAHYAIPFSTFIILPKDYSIGSRLEVTGETEDIYYKALDICNFFTNTTALINVKILDC